MADEIPTTISNVRSIEAPTDYGPNAVNPYSSSQVKQDTKPADWTPGQVAKLDAILRRIAALERAVNGRVSE